MLETIDIGPILDRMQEKRCVDFRLYRESTLRRRINRRMSACGCFDLPSYLSLLDSTPEELDRLFLDLTIKYTKFFRDSWVFDILKQDILPVIIAEKKRAKDTVRIWSAGCATGEEAYSLAILIRTIKESQAGFPTIDILATDIDPVALDTARKGAFRKVFLDSPLDEAIHNYFTDEDQVIVARQELKEIIRFHEHDLTNTTAVQQARLLSPEPFDLIICRNVLVYLKRAAQAGVLERLCTLLRPGSFLVLGTGEIPPKFMEAELQPVNSKVRIYQKTAV